MTERDSQLRQELVKLAERQRGPARRGTRTLIASVAAFAIAGAITGGTVAAVASSGGEDAEDDNVFVSVRVMAAQLVGEHTPLVGPPIEASRSGSSTIDLGAQPDGANAIAIAFHCTSVGTFTIDFNETPNGASYCLDESDTSPGHGMFGTFLVPDPTIQNTIKVTVDGQAGYTVWAAWVTRPEPQRPSADQAAALADGVVTEEEYRAGLDRYVACMAEAGFTVDVLDTAEPIARYVISNDAVLDGADERCYAAEFRSLDMEWQVSVNG